MKFESIISLLILMRDIYTYYLLFIQDTHARYNIVREYLFLWPSTDIDTFLYYRRTLR